MTFDEIFQQYVAQGFTKPMSGVSGVSGIETLMPTTATVAPIVPIQQPQDTGGGRDDDFTNVPDTTTNLGITSLSDAVQGLADLYGQLPTPLNLVRRGIENIQDPYKDIFGNLNIETQAAITREEVRDLQSRIDRGDFGGPAGGGGFEGHGGYGSSAERGGALHG